MHVPQLEFPFMDVCHTLERKLCVHKHKPEHIVSFTIFTMPHTTYVASSPGSAIVSTYTRKRGSLGSISHDTYTKGRKGGGS